MSESKGGIVGAIITVVVGSVAYSVSQADIVKNFSKDTGMSQQEAEQYVQNITEDDKASWSEIGSGFISDGQDFIDTASEIDCVNYEYEWETKTLSCEKGKSQLMKFGNEGVELGKAYKILDSESASTEDISLVIKLIDKDNANLNLEIVSQLLDNETINELKNTNSYNKSVLQAVLDSN